MLGILVTILTIVMVVVCLLMSLVVMMQRPKQEGLGAAFGGSLTDRMLGSGTTDFLQKATVYLGVLFFVLALTIATMMAWDRNADRLARGEDIKSLAGADEAAADEAVPPAAAVDVPNLNVPAAIPPAGNADAPPVIEIPAAAEESATPEAIADPVEESASAQDSGAEVPTPAPAEEPAETGDNP